MSDQSNGETSDNSEEQSGGDDRKTYDPTWLGWAVRIVSVLTFVGMVGLIGYKMASEDQEITFESKVVTEDIRLEGSDYFIPVEVSNEGSRTAQRVKMELDVGGETTEVEIDMIGASEKTRFVVTRPERFESVEHSVSSYETP